MDSFFSNEAYFCVLVIPKSVFKKLLLSIIDDWFYMLKKFGLHISIKDARLMQIFGLAMFLILMLQSKPVGVRIK